MKCASYTYISRDFPISLAHYIIIFIRVSTIFLNIQWKPLFVGTFSHSFAYPIWFLSIVTQVTLSICFCAFTCCYELSSLKRLPIITLRLPLSPHILCSFPQETPFTVRLRSLPWSPQLIVASLRPCIVTPSALRLMEWTKVQRYNRSFLTFAAVKQKVLTDGRRVINYVCHVYFLIWKLDLFSTHPFVSWEVKEVGGLLVIRHNDESPVVSDFINVASFSDFSSGESSISAQISINFFFIVTQMFPNIPNSNNNSEGIVSGVEWSVIFTGDRVEM